MSKITLIFTSVFHRILDFKAGLNFYSDPFFITTLSILHIPATAIGLYTIH
jgi:hypothetical protein